MNFDSLKQVDSPCFSYVFSALILNTFVVICSRKLLLHNEEIAKLIGKLERSGYTLVPIDMHFKVGRINIQIVLA
jgi:tmRNA-binding protein